MLQIYMKILIYIGLNVTLLLVGTMIFPQSLTEIYRDLSFLYLNKGYYYCNNVYK